MAGPPAGCPPEVALLMKTAPHVKRPKGGILPWSLTAAFLMAVGAPVRAGFCAVGCSGPIQVFENEPFARLDLHRGDTKDAETVEYFTEDMSALAGKDYLAQRGTATFATGQGTTTVEVPLVDNGLLDGPREFRLVVTRRGLFDEYSVEIQDNELRSVVDPSFAPDPGAPSGYRLAASMPEDRIVALVGRMLIVLGPDGSVEQAFDPAPDSGCAQVVSLHTLPDGRILVGLVDCDEWNPTSPILMRFLPAGTLDFVYSVPVFGGVAAVQPDGKVLALAIGDQHAPSLVRINLDSSMDPGFRPFAGMAAIHQVTVMDDGRILVGGNGKGDSGPFLVRLHSDGTSDPTLSLRTSGDRFLLRADGRLIVRMRDSDRVIQLNADGSLDPSFSLDPLFGSSVPPVPLIEGPSSTLLVAGKRHCNGPGRVALWNVAGRLEWDISVGISTRSPCFDYTPSLLTTTSGHVLALGNFTSVEGLPRRGLARLMLSPPERQFHAVAPASLRASAEVASIQVMRTGPTTAAASIAFRTGDGTAVAGQDYVARSGTLTFAPLEVSQEIRVPLIPGSLGDHRRSFRLEVSDPSPGYAVIETTPIHILPDLRIEPESSRPHVDGSNVLTLRGTLPGRWYGVEASTDLKLWEPVDGSMATGNFTAIGLGGASPSRRFFRVFGGE